MKTKFAIACVLTGMLLAPVVSVYADSTDTDRSSPSAWVKDSEITTKIKTGLAAEHMGSLAHIQVDTDAKGHVMLSGNCESQAAIDKAVSIAKGTEGVVSVKNNLTIKTG